MGANDTKFIKMAKLQISIKTFDNFETERIKENSNFAGAGKVADIESHSGRGNRE